MSCHNAFRTAPDPRYSWIAQFIDSGARGRQHNLASTSGTDQGSLRSVVTLFGIWCPDVSTKGRAKHERIKGKEQDESRFAREANLWQCSCEASSRPH
ncbi:hypothetical protein V5799_013048 [Amblyomma americanum]|uniref:Uncharacterized protein n=1 Tax=Amblyomma americanum TaxID=6943 RepID=A0AAQ4E747_AMBAM